MTTLLDKSFNGVHREGVGNLVLDRRKVVELQVTSPVLESEKTLPFLYDEYTRHKRIIFMQFGTL